MKHRGRFTVALVLTLALQLSAFAGVIHTPAPAPPPPHESVTTAGDISTGVSGDTETTAQTSDSVVDIALSLAQSVLALF